MSNPNEPRRETRTPEKEQTAMPVDGTVENEVDAARPAPAEPATAPPREDARAAAREDARADAIEQERREYGGMQVGSAFFGWLAAGGAAILLTTVIAAIGAAIGLSNETNLSAAADTSVQTLRAAGIVAAVILVIVVFAAYFVGGYVAGRLARASGALQGLAVWLWAVAIAVVSAVLGAIAGDGFAGLSAINGLPQVPARIEDLAVAGIVTAVIATLASLGGAILGGIVGARQHQRIDAEVGQRVV